MNLATLFRRRRAPSGEMTVRADQVLVGDQILSEHFHGPDSPSNCVIEVENYGGPERGNFPSVYLSVPGRYARYVTQLYPDDKVTILRRRRRWRR